MLRELPELTAQAVARLGLRREDDATTPKPMPEASTPMSKAEGKKPMRPQQLSEAEKKAIEIERAPEVPEIDKGAGSGASRDEALERAGWEATDLPQPPPSSPPSPPFSATRRPSPPRLPPPLRAERAPSTPERAVGGASQHGGAGLGSHTPVGVPPEHGSGGSSGGSHGSGGSSGGSRAPRPAAISAGPSQAEVERPGSPMARQHQWLRGEITQIDIDDEAPSADTSPVRQRACATPTMPTSAGSSGGLLRHVRQRTCPTPPMPTTTGSSGGRPTPPMPTSTGSPGGLHGGLVRARRARMRRLTPELPLQEAMEVMLQSFCTLCLHIPDEYS